uniref:Uncharacterized protein n=1 Tax=Aegilops tauschii subsp. strangulata TaxID=200361 RepID=A0A453B2S3_AEGTS
MYTLHIHPHSAARQLFNATVLTLDQIQFGMSTTSLDMSGMDDYLQLQQYFIACTVRTKRGCATHPQSIAERIS